MRERGNRRLRWVDRYVGIPVLVGLRVFRRRHTFPHNVTRIGVLKLTAIGDTLLMGGIARDLAEAFPEATVVMFTGSMNAAAAKMLTGPTEVVTLKTTSPWALIRQLRRQRVDLLFDGGSWTRLEAVSAALSGSAFSVGFRTAGQFRHWCYDRAVTHSSRVHERDNYARLVAAVAPSQSAPQLRGPAAPPEWLLPRRKFVVLHPWPSGFRSELKEWPEDRWVELATRLLQEGHSVVLTGGPADVARSQQLAAAIRSSSVSTAAHSDVVDIAGKATFDELLEVVYVGDCVVSVNTGVMHLAAIAGVPTVSLDGPTAAARWGPVGERAMSVESAFPGCGYVNLGGECRGRRTDCMLGISVDRVFAAVQDLISAPPRHTSEAASHG